MLKLIFKKNQISSIFQSVQFNFGTVVHQKGTPNYQVETENVQLRGSYIKGNYADLPTMIFFADYFDPVTNWIPFFNNPDNKFLDYRNIWLVNPRNFGNSDRCDSFDMEQQANDVLRFMYQNKISTATLGGHGFGAKLALATGCYHADRTSGIFSLCSGPLDHRYYEPFYEMKGYVNQLSQLNLNNTSQKELHSQLKELIQCPKWRSIFKQNLSAINENNFKWNFEMKYINKNLQWNKADSLGSWNEKTGLYTGRVCFIAPEYSRWFHLNTNTLAIYRTCIKAKGFGQDVFAIQSDENPLNHWMYDIKDLEFSASRKLLQFIRLYDGVHVQLHDRSEVGKAMINDKIYSRTNPNHIYSDYSPQHLHHNWRYTDIYEKAAEAKKSQQ